MVMPTSIPDMNTFVHVCRRLDEVLANEPNLVKLVAKSALIVGDIHGDLEALERVMELVASRNYDRVIFLGDYVDRGANSIMCLYYVMKAKLHDRRKFVLLRGNHEASINRYYGFLDEVTDTYGSKKPWLAANRMFTHLPLCAVINNQIFAVHGGISSGIKSIQDIEKFDRTKAEDTAALGELMWNDPREFVDTFSRNTDRGGYRFFGQRALEDFLTESGLNMVVRSHEYEEDGYWYMWDWKLLTIFSTATYYPWASNRRCVCEVRGDKIIVMDLDDMRPLSTRGIKPLHHKSSISKSKGWE